eukprot:m.88854 g.88854  ORF g.88854 m.88854 type:complete len:339 (-) comp8515_c0_seq5:84-1100(-)
MRALAAVAVALLCLLARDGSALETPQSRAAARIFATRKQREGGGFWVRRSVGSPALPELDPFLMLDHLGPTAYGPGEAVGAPDHPHRGFETVTYVLQGGFHHLDSAGNSGHLGPGAVQWMTAGRGVVHSEMPAKDLMRDGGVMEGFQLWVNLPAQHKMIAPRYQDIAPEDVPEAHGVNVSVRVIAGESILGTSAVIDTKIPITFLDVRLQPSGSLDETLPGDNAFAYVYRGDCTVAGSAVKDGDAVVFGPGNSVSLSAPTSACGVLLLAANPIGEPISRMGPFVMNTDAEIRQAIDDYRNGRLGEIPGAELRYAETQAARAAEDRCTGDDSCQAADRP